LAQLRTGECRELGKFRGRLNEENSLCRWCKDTNESVIHVFQDCEGKRLIEARLNLVENTGIQSHECLKALAKFPAEALIFIKDALSMI
jgi:hypothetical protein